MCILCPPHDVDVHKGEGSGSCGLMWTEERGGQKPDSFVDFINGWPLIHENEVTIQKLVRLGYLPLSTPSFEVLCNTANSNLFACILNNSRYAWHRLIPPIRITLYSMRTRSRNREISRFD